jgi:hypothetical protein
MVNLAEERINEKLAEIQQGVGKSITELLRETNKTKLAGKGKVSAHPIRERSGLRWTLAWHEGKVAYDLNVVVNVEDDGKETRVSKVLVHRHASADYDYEGHIPTTRMRRLAKLDIAEIKDAITAEMK